MNDEKFIELVEKARKEDKEALSEIYDYYSKIIIGFVYKRVLHTDDTKDIVSNTFLKILQNISKFRFKKKKAVYFHAWVYRIAINEMNTYFRKKKKFITKMDQDQFLEYFTKNNLDEQNRVIECDQNYKLLLYHMKGLKIRDQNLIQLRYIEHKTFSDIARILEIKKESTVRVYLHRAIARLKKIIPPELLENSF